MRKLPAVLVASVVGVLGAFAILHPAGPATADNACYNKAASQAELDRCADARARVSQRRVDAAYAALQKTVSGAELRGVQSDQRAWQAYRKANCESVSSVLLPDSGSMAPMINLECYTQRDEERAAYLRWRGESFEQRDKHRMP